MKVPRRSIATVVATVALTGSGLAVASPASAAWEDCGDYVCTTYYSRTETRAVKEYADNVVPQTLGIVTGLCSVIGDWFGKAGGGVAAGGCSIGLDSYDWRGDLDDAVSSNACFQVAYPNAWWGRITPDAGSTNHPGYCFD